MNCMRPVSANKKSGTFTNGIAIIEEKSNLDESSVELGKEEVSIDQKQDFEFSEGQAS